jgi:hypothetical protein
MLACVPRPALHRSFASFTKAGVVRDSSSRPFESFALQCVSPVEANAGKTLREEGFTTKWKTLMNMRTLSVIALVTAAVSSPVLAQEVGGSAAQKPVHALRHYRSAYDQVQRPDFVTPRVGAYGNTEGKFDPSRPGGYDPDFRPSGS